MPSRQLSVHEYQAAEIMRKFGISVPSGSAASTPEEAYSIAKTLKGDICVKAQVLAGGRGKGTFTNGFKSGVHVVQTPAEAREIAAKMLGQRLVTKQTGPAGKPVSKVLIMPKYVAKRENYVAFLLDRASQGPVAVVSPRGGVNIEEVAEQDPGAIFKEQIDIVKGLTKEQAERLAGHLRLEGGPGKKAEAARQIERLYAMMIATDATMVEVNPFVETPDGSLVALDAKVNFDDNAAFRQKEIHALRDTTQEDPREVAAQAADLNFIGLDGNIGCLVNGAGLAMATMDMIKLKGGAPANFLDVGGGATEKQVTTAFQILAADPKVSAVLVNIFGGIMRCDIIALGIISATKTLKRPIPIVVRLAGTRLAEAQSLLESSGLRLIMAEDLDDGASKACRIVQIQEMAEQAKLKVSFELPL
jgi:succinyl-CoA synthetase beta subunit